MFCVRGATAIHVKLLQIQNRAVFDRLAWPVARNKHLFSFIVSELRTCTLFRPNTTDTNDPIDPPSFAGNRRDHHAVLSVCGARRNNIEATLNLLECMKMQDGCRNLVFSSSATVYGVPESLPLHEGSPVGIGITNPYGV